jgi:hypothetical protein
VSFLWKGISFETFDGQKANLCLHLHAYDMSMSTVIYARENSPASQSPKLKSGLDAGVSSIIIT